MISGHVSATAISKPATRNEKLETPHQLKDPTVNRATAAQLVDDYNRRHPERPLLNGMKLIKIYWQMTETVPVEMPPDTILYYMEN